MKVDLYLKVVLTVIALALALNLLKPVLDPTDVEARGDGKFEGVQMGIAMGAVSFFDTNTGEIWVYNRGFKNSAVKVSISQLGEPIVAGK